MSEATVIYLIAAICAAPTCPVSMAMLNGVDAVWWLSSLCAFFMVARHRENINRLIAHTEPKFSLKSR